MVNTNKFRLAAATAFVLFLAALTGCSLKGPNGPDEPQVQAPLVPSDLTGDWEGTLTVVRHFGTPDSVAISFPITFTFDDTSYESRGGHLWAEGIYERPDDTILVLHNDHPYLAIYDLSWLPASYYPLRLKYRNDTLQIIATGTEAHPDWYGWQRISLVRVEE